MNIRLLVSGVLAGLLMAAAVSAADMPADEIVSKALNAYYYAKNDSRVQVQLRLVNKAGRERERNFITLRLDKADGGDQYYYTYFTSPPDVQRTVFLVWKQVGGDDQRWLYLPAVDLVKRIAARDKRSSFVGSDFTYEDVSGRHVAADTHTLLREETLDGREAYVIKSTPRDAGEVEFSYRRMWVAKDNFLTLKVEFYDKRGELYKVMRVTKTETIQGVPTITAVEMQSLASGHTTYMNTGSVEYDIGLDEKSFHERYLRRPPRSWIKPE